MIGGRNFYKLYPSAGIIVEKLILFESFERKLFHQGTGDPGTRT